MVRGGGVSWSRNGVCEGIMGALGDQRGFCRRWGGLSVRDSIRFIAGQRTKWQRLKT